MRKNLIVSITIILIILACTIFISDGLTYLITSLMALAIMGTIQRNRSWFLKMTRWAKANPKKAQLIITGLQLVLMAIGIFAGNNFRELGYEFSDITPFVFSNILIAAFLSVHFLPKRGTIAIPKAVNRQRFAFMCIALSSFVMMVITGNRIGDMYPNSPVIHAIKAIDQAIFQDDNTQYAAYFNKETLDSGYKKNQEQVLMNGSSYMLVFASFIGKEKDPVASSIDPTKEVKAKLKAQTKKFEKRIKKVMNRIEKKKRLFAAGGMSVGSVALIVLLVILTCAGACLVAGGISAMVGGEALGLLAILGGILLGYLAIKGISNVSKKSKKQKEGNP